MDLNPGAIGVVKNMTQMEIIDKEIAPKGKCYIICTSFDERDFESVLAELCGLAATRGAKRIYFACKDQSNFLDRERFSAGRYQFAFYSDFEILEKALVSTDVTGAGMLKIKPLRQSNSALWLALYNESFYEVPNSMTMGEEDVDSILASGERDGGFFMLGGEPIGVFELRYDEAVPEIAAICIRPTHRGKGYGAMALHLLEARLLGEGHRIAQILVATANARAYGLYLKKGYQISKRLSRWYETVAEEVKTQDVGP